MGLNSPWAGDWGAVWGGEPPREGSGCLCLSGLVPAGAVSCLLLPRDGNYLSTILGLGVDAVWGQGWS